jgi:hypothetical protein
MQGKGDKWAATQRRLTVTSCLVLAEAGEVFVWKFHCYIWLGIDECTVFAPSRRCRAVLKAATACESGLP